MFELRPGSESGVAEGMTVLDKTMLRARDSTFEAEQNGGEH
jgi:hypothetical protein